MPSGSPPTYRRDGVLLTDSETSILGSSSQKKKTNGKKKQKEEEEQDKMKLLYKIAGTLSIYMLNKYLNTNQYEFEVHYTVIIKFSDNIIFFYKV